MTFLFVLCFVFFVFCVISNVQCDEILLHRVNSQEVKSQEVKKSEQSTKWAQAQSPSPTDLLRSFPLEKRPNVSDSKGMHKCLYVFQVISVVQLPHLNCKLYDNTNEGE